MLSPVVTIIRTSCCSNASCIDCATFVLPARRRRAQDAGAVVADHHERERTGLDRRIRDGCGTG
jgi:hypothetical protein